MNMSTVLSFTWKPSTTDIRTGIALSFWGTHGRLVRTFLSLYFLPGLAFSSITSSPIYGLLFGGLFGSFFILISLPLFAWITTRKQRAYSSVQEISVTGEYVERTVAGTSIRTHWSAVTRVVELPNVFLLFVGMIPVGSIEKSAVPDTQSLQALHALIASSVTQMDVRLSSWLAFEPKNTAT